MRCLCTGTGPRAAAAAGRYGRGRNGQRPGRRRLRRAPRTRPGQYILACADGGAYLASLHWATWGSSAAFADGISTFNDCVPNCAAGHGHSFPVLVVLWRPAPLAGHVGERYFTRLTIIYTGSRTYSAGGKQYHLPATATDPLSAYGGA